MKQRKIVLESGRSFVGEAFGADKDALCELVFNTSMAGYQEILSDPSYCDQAVVMTYPLIGNYGMCDDDYETERPAIGAMIVRHYNDHPSNFRAAESLGQAMERFGIPGVSGVDTRALTRLIRSQGSQKALITDADTPLEDCLARLAGPLPSDAVSRVSRPYVTVYPAREPRFHVAAVDCGMKRNIVRSLNRLGCTVTVLPWDTAAAQIEPHSKPCARTAFSSPTGPAIPRTCRRPCKPCEPCWGSIRSSASAWAIRSSASPTGRGPTSSSSATGAATTPSGIWTREKSKSPRRTIPTR